MLNNLLERCFSSSWKNPQFISFQIILYFCTKSITIFGNLKFYDWSFSMKVFQKLRTFTRINISTFLNKFFVISSQSTFSELIWIDYWIFCIPWNKLVKKVGFTLFNPVLNQFKSRRFYFGIKNNKK
jgi:hypothetical protein